MDVISINSYQQLVSLCSRWKKQLLSKSYSDFIILSNRLGTTPSQELLFASHAAETLEELLLSNTVNSGFKESLSNQIDDVIDTVLIKKGCSFSGEAVPLMETTVNELPRPIANLILIDVISILKINNSVKASIINAIKNNQLRYETVAKFVQDRTEALRQMRRLLSLEPEVVGQIDESIQNLLMKEPLLINDASKQQSFDEAPCASLQDLYLCVESALNVLTDREQKVLRMRFGIGGSENLTLEEVGKQFGVTRERIRQIEAKGLRKLRHPSRINNIKNLCIQLRREIFSQMSNADGVVVDESHKHYLNEVDPRLVLGIVISEGKIQKWLDQYFPKLGSGWASLEFPQTELIVAEQKIKALIKQISLPVPISALNKFGRVKAFKTVLALSNVANQFDGYLCERGPVYERTRRAIRLHRLARLHFPNDAYASRAILKLHNESHPDSATNLRLIEMDMGKYSHLFIRIYEHLWSKLGDWGPVDSLPAEEFRLNETEESLTTDSTADQECRHEEDESLSLTESLEKILRENGPMGFVDLRQAMRDAYGPGFADGSMVLVNIRDEFVRLAPGVYALAGFDVDSDIPVAALTEYQTRIYSIARKGGEVDGYYPLWTRKYEMELCKWAKQSVDHRLFESLLDVIEPSSWPCSNEYSMTWGAEKSERADYQLYRDPKPNLVKPDICPVELLSILKILHSKGSVSWMTINRCMNERLDSMCAVWILGLLVSIKAVITPKHWQLPHYAGENLLSVLNSLEGELIMMGSLNWHKGAAEEVLTLACRENGMENKTFNHRKIFRSIANKYAMEFTANSDVNIENSFDEFLEKHQMEKEQSELDILFESL